MAKPTAMKKVFLQPLFGEPYPWTQQYLDNIAQVKGWNWIIFTPHALKGGRNTAIMRMDLKEWDRLVLKATGVDPKNYVSGVAPHKNLTDYYPAYGHIFSDFIQGYSYWGHTNWDCVYGDLSRFLPDEELAKALIWADETNAVNGTFSVYKNTPEVNTLYQQVPGWEQAFTDHKLFGFDETSFSKYAVENGYVTCPPHYPFHSYDRLPQHIPTPQLELIDGHLYEKFTDTRTGRVTGKEIMYFHFSTLKH